MAVDVLDNSSVELGDFAASCHSSAQSLPGCQPVNRHVDRIKRLFRWGCAKKIVPADNLVNLLAVASLKAGRSVARETLHVAPVAIESIDAILPFLPPVPTDMVRLLLLTGARIGELCQLCSRDLDRSGPVWLFQVYRHKTRHRGHDRTVAFGPQAQLILRRYLKADPDAVLFSPAEQDAFLKAAINHAMRRACIKAGIPIWHTHQLRHSAALLIMREHGIEAARSVLGHRTLNMTLHYSGIDLELAKEVAKKTG
jgi:integrase